MCYMKKSAWALLLAGTAHLTLLCLTGYLFINFFGPHMNDNFAVAQKERLEALPLPDGTVYSEVADFVGRMEPEGDFVIVVSMAFITALPPQEFEAMLQEVPGFGGAEVVPYNHEKASRLELSGIQKELWEKETTDCYLAVIPFAPRTKLDKRNK